MIALRGSRVVSIKERTGDKRECYRCGIVWRDSRYDWKADAPCSDCRPILRKEGVDITEYQIASRAREKASA